MLERPRLPLLAVTGEACGTAAESRYPGGEPV